MILRHSANDAKFLGHVLFLMYVNDIDDAIMCKILNFADDPKITRKVAEVTESE